MKGGGYIYRGYPGGVMVALPSVHHLCSDADTLTGVSCALPGPCVFVRSGARVLG